MPERDMVLPFLGHRDYLHSTTLLNALLPFVTDAAEVVLKVARPVRTNHVVCRWGDNDPEAAATVWAGCPTGPKTITIHEGGSHRADVKVAYPEHLIVDGWQERDGRAILSAGGPWTFAERLVALNKAYLSHRYPLGEGEQFLATRLEIRGSIPGPGRLEVEHVRTMGGRHHVSRFVQDGRDMGLLYFARQPIAP